MLKKYILIMTLTLIISICGNCFALKPIWKDVWINILTKEDKSIIDPPEDHAMMQWTHTAVQTSEGHKITNISNTNTTILSQEEAENKTLDMIHRLINRVLWILAFVALIVVIFGWFQMVTAAWDDAKYKSWKTALKKVSIGIIGIWISWLFVSLAFRFVDIISK